MSSPAMACPRIGLLALSLELYESLAPSLRGEREAWLRKRVLPVLAKETEVLFERVVFTREEVDAQVAAFEAQGADALLIILLSYSPSQIALPALSRTRLPIIVWNTQELWAVDDTFKSADLTANHGVHGTQDLCNVLLRAGARFEYVTSHVNDAGAVEELNDFFRAAAAVRSLRRARLGLLGYPFPGMGDFALDTTHMAATLGCEWVNLPLSDYAQRAAGADPRAVARLVKAYRAEYDVAKGVTPKGLEDAARGELALRALVEEHRLSALTYQFLAFGKEEATKTVPFVGVSRLMAEGIGFGGEGDLIAAAGTALLQRLCPPAGFTEIFTIDFGGNSLFMSHMGEANAAMARKDRKTPLIAQPSPITRADAQQLALLTSFQPGPATLFALTLADAGRWRLIASAVAVADFGPLPALQSPHAKLIPRGDVRDFLTAYAKVGGPHHNALCFGDARRRIRLAARMLDADYREV